MSREEQAHCLIFQNILVPHTDLSSRKKSEKEGERERERCVANWSTPLLLLHMEAENQMVKNCYQQSIFTVWGGHRVQGGNLRYCRSVAFFPGPRNYPSETGWDLPSFPTLGSSLD